MASENRLLSSNPPSPVQGTKGPNIDRIVDHAPIEIGAVDLTTTAPPALFSNASKFVVHNLHADASPSKGDSGSHMDSEAVYRFDHPTNHD